GSAAVPAQAIELTSGCGEDPRMHPAPGPPSEAPATLSVAKTLPCHVFVPQAALASTRSHGLPVTVLFRIRLFPADAAMAMPSDWPSMTVLSSTRLPESNTKMPLMSPMEKLRRI